MRVSFFTLLFLFFHSFISFSQDWIQLGLDIDGDQAGSGRSVSLSDDGTIVAIGEPYNQGSNFLNREGLVRVYKFENNIWTQLGQDIYGEDIDDQSGYSVSLSGDGSTVTIGSPGKDANKGTVRVYQYANNTWTKLGADIDGEATGDQSGISVSLSNDGTRVAIGARMNDDNGDNSGHVRVYEYSNNTWTQLGQDINGEAANDQSGHSVSLSSDGTILAIGAPNNDGVKGHVRVYGYSNNSWTKLGSDIDGEAANNESGSSVSLSSDGTKVAIGAPNNDGINGHVRVYEYANNSWTQLGADIDAVVRLADRFGTSVSLSNDGTKVAIGATQKTAGGSQKGYAQIYDYSNNTWTKIGAVINGEGNDDEFGRSISLSRDGTKVAIGAPNNDGNGSNSGHVRVYQHQPTLPSVTLAVSGATQFSETGGNAKIITSIPSIALQEVQASFTISGTANANDYKFYSVPPRGLTYSNWHPGGEPNNASNGQEHYAVMLNDDIGNNKNVWNDMKNNFDGNTYNYIIEVEEEVTYLNSSATNQPYTYIGKYQGHSYFVSPSKETSWTNARDKAFQDGGYLVVISSESENNTIAGWLDNYTGDWNLIIGLYQDLNDPNYSEPSGGWKWVSKEISNPLQSKIKVGRKSDVFYLVPTSDYVDENDETVILDIADVIKGTENGNQQVTVTITDDDEPANVTLSTSSSTQLSETNGSATIKASIPTPAPKDVTIKLGFSGTASGTDYSYENFTTDGLMLYLPLDSNVNDASGNGNNGTINGALSYTEDNYGNADKAMVFGGNGTIVIPYSETMAIKDDITMSMWAWFNNSGGHVLMFPKPGGLTYTSMRPLMTNDGIGFYFRAAGQEWEWVYSSSNTGMGMVEINKWSHITYTNDMDSAKLYVNGVLYARAKVAYDLDYDIYTQGDTYIGSETLNNEFFNGKLDEIRFYNRALSATEIADLYTLENPILASSIESTNRDIVIKEGKKSATLNIIPVSDNIDEDDETVVVDIESVTNGFENTDQQLIFTISDDDDAPEVSLSLSSDKISEYPDDSVAVIATLANASSRDVEVTLTTSGTSTAGTDYKLSSNTITILAGDTTGTTYVSGVIDQIADENETVIIDISSVTNAIEKTEQQVTITILEPYVTLSVSKNSIPEFTGEKVVVTATLVNGSSRSVEVLIATSGTATDGTDYTLGYNLEPINSDTIKILAGDTTGTTFITAVSDQDNDPNETIIIDISSVANAIEKTEQQVTITINEDLCGFQIPVFQNTSVCYVSSDSADYTKNRIFVKTGDDFYNVDKYRIYREGSSIGSYNLIGEIDAALDDNFLDTISDNRSRSYKYRVSMVDKCGVESNQSTEHITHHLVANQGISGEINLNWSKYLGLDFGTYEIFRKKDISPFEKIGAVSADVLSFSDFNVSGESSYKYFVAVVADVECRPEGGGTGGINVYQGDNNNVFGIGQGGRKTRSLRSNTFALAAVNNSAPSIGDQSFSIQENSAEGTEVGTIVATDADNDALLFTITGGSGGSTFSVEETTGKLTVKDNTKLDASMNSSLKLAVKVSDGSSDASAEMTINITSKVLAIEEVASQIFNVYPIPAQRKLKVVLKDNVEVERIEFIDYSGKAIAPKHSKRKDNTLTLDVSNLYSGIYILNLVTEKGTSKARVIIER